MRLVTPSDSGLPWFRRFADSIIDAFKQEMDAPFGLWRVATADLPAAPDFGGRAAYNITTTRVTYSDGSAWKELQPYSAVLASFGGLAIVQGDLIYGSAANTVSRLAKDANATRYLANSGTSNNPAWAQVDLTNGVTGRLPFANIAQLTARSVLGVTGNATADGAAIQGTANQVLRVNGAGTALAFGAIDLSQSAAVSGILAAANGGTANGFTAFSGPATATKTFTLPNATDTIGCLGTIQTWSAVQTFSAIPVLSGGGVKFPATQVPSADVNTLDDYEEGTFTPTLLFNSAATGMTYSSQLGKYTKVGRLVTIEIKIVLTAKGSSTGPATIAGLPFTTGAAPNAAGAFMGGNLVTVAVPFFLLSAGSTAMSLFDFSGSTWTSLFDTDFSNTSEIYLATTYAT